MENSHDFALSPQVKGTLALSFDPIIQQHTYNSQDVTGLLRDTALLDLSSNVVILKPLPNTYLEEMETSAAFKLCLKECESRQAVGSIKRNDFFSLPLRVENVIVAISVSLWRTTLRSNDLIKASRDRFLSGLDEKRRSKKNKLPIRLLFKFLNEMGVDVVVMSSEKESVAVFRARSLQRKRVSDLNNTKSSISLVKKRTLLALEFDEVCGMWSPLQLPPLVSLPLMLSPAKRKQRSEHETLDETRSQSQSLGIIHMGKINATPSSLFELGQTGNMDTMVFDRTVYNPQMVPVKVNGDETTIKSKGDEKATAQHSPFAGMKYPNVNQLDLQLWEVLRRGLHPVLRRNRIRCMVTFPLALIAFSLGLALIIYLRVSLESCFYYTSRDVCVYANEETSIENCTSPFFNNTNGDVLGKSVNAFLFGYAASPGTFIVTVTCCMFVAAIMGIAVNYFTTRAIATKSSVPLFYIVIMTAHIILGAVGCGFSAYALYVFSYESHKVSCSWFDTDTNILCTAAINLCSDITIEVHLHNRVRVVLTLSILLLFFSTVQFLASLIPPMPDRKTIEALAKADPETYVFYPSVYAPDGISEADKKWLRTCIARRLRLQLREEVKLHNFLLTRNATIGEMMQANIAQSLKGGGELRETNAHDKQWKGFSENHQSPLHYMSTLDDSTNLSVGVGGKQQQKRNNEEREVRESKRRRREIPSRILAEVEEISQRVKASKEYMNTFS
ncbi:hypothetical protein LSM04_006612 [Trypanosoma melophagium]|uniref:uncharacterized protein n=1 Tax=Trypanosoma melophagium TaxID=715481 RepID=UPI00351A6273|nr:hypothetical protein LSM04_006612 [Trypanosoma melophagium]